MQKHLGLQRPPPFYSKVMYMGSFHGSVGMSKLVRRDCIFYGGKS